MRVFLPALFLLLAAFGCSRTGPSELKVRDAGDLFERLEIPLPEGASVPDAVGPRRIVSVIPSMTENLHALGLGARIVGRDRWSDMPPFVRDLPSVGDQRTMSVEKIADLRPDLVLLWKSMPELATALTRDFGIRIVTPETESEGAFSGIVETAEACGLAERGRALVAFLDEDRRRIEAKFRGRPRRSLLLVLDRGQTGLFVAAPGSFLDGLFASAGLANAAASASGPWASLSAEALSELAPDAILDLSIGEGERGRLEAAGFWKRFSHFPAVASGRVVVARGAPLVRPGPRFHRAAEALGDLIHGL